MPTAFRAFAASTSLLASALLVFSACSELPTAPNQGRSTVPPVFAEDLATTTTTFAEALATTTTTFASDPTWLPASQNVCLNASSPSPCPAGATQYGYAGSGWTAPLSTIPGATWIWAAGITGATVPAFPAEFTFSKTFSNVGLPISGSISVAADDFAAILVNGILVGTTGSRTDAALAGAASSSLKTFDIGPFLVPGTNVISVEGANGNFGCGSGAYSCNPAGVVFGGSLSFQGNPATKDECKNGGWVIFAFENQGQCVRFIETGKDSR
jgi:hypothetical protein